ISLIIKSAYARLELGGADSQVTGSRQALALRSGSWIKCQRFKVAEGGDSVKVGNPTRNLI
ncbi:MAG: hypothetical protein JSW50_07535, partial [Candidatus Latescibacterota bacterium]